MGLLDSFKKRGPNYLTGPNFQAIADNAPAGAVGAPGGLLAPPPAKAPGNPLRGLLATGSMSPGPVGDITGLLADSLMYYEQPESRKPSNYAMTALGALLPFVPGVAGSKIMGDMPSILDEIVRGASKKGVALDVYANKASPNLITLSKIEVPKAERGKGVGSAAMDELVRFADESGKTIALSPSTDFGASSVARLKEFYKRFGFVENKGRAKDLEISESMYRAPKGVTR